MTHRLILASALTLILCSAGISQPAAPTITKMDNGLTVIVQEDHATELVGVDVWVKAGTINETKENNGISHFIEHLVFSMTDRRLPGDMDLEMESLGATLNAHTSRDWAHFSTTVSSRYLPKALDILSDAVSSAQFRETDIEQEKLVILDEIAKAKTDPMSFCRDKLARELYGSHPYSMPVEGINDTVKKITRDQILDYYHRLYVPANMAVVLVGDIDPGAALSEVGKVFQGMRKGDAVKGAVVAPVPPAKQVVESEKESYSKNYLSIGFLGPQGADYKEVCATDILLTAVGFGYNSWTKEELEKKGLASDVSVEFLTQKDAGLISIVAGTTPDNTVKVRDAIFAKLAEIRTSGLDEMSLALAKRSLLGQFAFQNETVGGLAATYGFYFAVSGPEFASKYVDYVSSVTNDDVKNAALKYLDPDKAVILTVGSGVEVSK